MALIQPFQALRYTPYAGEFSQLVAPVHDTLTWGEREHYASKSSHNVVHLTLPEQHTDDRNKFVRYARSAARLSEWRERHFLRPDPKDCFYRYIQRFKLPGDPKLHERVALITLLKIEPSEKNIVLPHEQIFTKYKEDRLRLLETTCTHLESIFGLYEDEHHEVSRKITYAKTRFLEKVITQDRVEHQLECIEDPIIQQEIIDAMASKKIWIADGHHRYEAAHDFRIKLGQKDHLIPEDFIPIALTSMSDPGLAILPTHRILHQLSISQKEFVIRLSKDFELTDCPTPMLIPSLKPLSQKKEHVLAVVLPHHQGIILRPKNISLMAEKLNLNKSNALKQLDVSILHHFIFDNILGLKNLDAITYTRSNEEALEAPGNGAAASFILNPPTVEDMKTIALLGEKMPAKSTYYYPKILGGLLFWSFADKKVN